jgi:hypothetical protein
VEGTTYISHSTPSGRPDNPPLKKRTGKRGIRRSVGSFFGDFFHIFLSLTCFVGVITVAVFWHIFLTRPVNWPLCDRM